MPGTKLHITSPVICQFTIDGHHHDLNGFVASGPIEGDPDKVRVNILVPPALADENTGHDNLLHSPVTFGRVLQHGDKHATFRYANE